MESARPVICAVEDTEVARHAAVASKWLARILGAPLLLAHVFDPGGIGVPPVRDMAAASVTIEDLEDWARQRAHRLIEEQPARSAAMLRRRCSKTSRSPACCSWRLHGARASL